MTPGLVVPAPTALVRMWLDVFDCLPDGMGCGDPARALAQGLIAVSIDERAVSEQVAARVADVGDEQIGPDTVDAGQRGRHSGQRGLGAGSAATRLHGSADRAIRSAR